MTGGSLTPEDGSGTDGGERDRSPGPPAPLGVRELQEIRDLVNRYALCNDTWRVDELIELFTPTATFDMTPAGLGCYRGQEEIRRFFEKERNALSHVMHLTSNHLIDGDCERASGTAYFLAMGITRDGTENHARGYYDDVYRRTRAGWRFASRRSCPLLPFTPIRGGGTR